MSGQEELRGDGGHTDELVQRFQAACGAGCRGHKDTELTVNSGRGGGWGGVVTSLRAEVKRLNISYLLVSIVVTDNSRCSGLGQ